MRLYPLVCCWLLHRGWAGRLMTACTFPVPRDVDFAERCRHLYSISLCDPDRMLETSWIEPLQVELERLDSTIDDRKFSVALAVVDRLHFPTLNSWHRFDPDFLCLPRNMTTDYRTEGFDDHEAIRLFVDLSADMLRRRWFQTDCHANLLILAVHNYGSLMHSDYTPSFPAVTISLSPKLSEIVDDAVLDEMKMRATGDLIAGRPVGKIVETAIHSLVRAYDEREKIVGPTKLPANHIPTWALKVFAASFALSALFFFLDWLILTRKRPRVKYQQGGGSSKWRSPGLLAANIRKNKGQAGTADLM